MRLEGRVALVTGGSRGIGRAIAVGLAAEGASVVLTYRASFEAAAETVHAIEQASGRARSCRLRFDHPEDFEGAVAAAVDEYGRLDVLVNNAAQAHANLPWSSIGPADWDQMMETNARSCFMATRAALPSLQQSQHGRIINITSVTFWTGQADLVHYVAAKGAVVGFTRSMARALGPEKITVNAVAPGAIQTEWELAEYPDQERIAAEMERVQAIKRRGLPSDIVGAVSFLASSDSSFITGQTIHVNGGWVME